MHRMHKQKKDGMMKMINELTTQRDALQHKELVLNNQLTDAKEKERQARLLARQAAVRGYVEDGDGPSAGGAASGAKQAELEQQVRILHAYDDACMCALAHHHLWFRQ